MTKKRRSLASFLPDTTGKPQQKMLLMAAGIIIGAIILVAIVAGALTVLRNGPVATPTPTPATPTPAPSPTATPVPTPTPAPTPAAGRVYDYSGPFALSALYRGDSGVLVVGITLSPGAANVNVSNLSISIVCDGKTYPNVWTIRPLDWDKAEAHYSGNTTLTPDDNVVPILDTVKLGIPQGKPLTVKITRNGDFFQEITVAPS